MEQTFMKEKKILPLVLSMSLPMMLSMLVNSLYNIVDSYFVAQISEQAMTALSLVYPLQLLETEMIAESYELVTDSPTKRIYEAVKKIPKGHVATYGQVAQMAGNPKMARAVGNALHKNPDPEHIPCFRVVNGKGELAGEFAFGGEGGQSRLLEEDGIPVENGRVDLEKYGITLRE